ncbi:MAG: type IV secretory system conjugative DNA transfer family protein [Pyrinomonadaceae bacterium]
MKDVALFLGLVATVLAIVYFSGPGLGIHPSTNLIVFMAAAVLIFCIFIFTIPRNKFKTGISHGSAAWANSHDVSEMLTMTDTKLAQGALMLCPSPWSRSQRLDIPHHLTLRHTVIIGPSGSGKGRGFFLWNCANFCGSFITSDPKSEAWTLTSGFHQKAIRFAPRDPNNSQAFNWIPLCGKDTLLCLLLARAVMTADEDEGAKADGFWVKAESALLAAVFAHASTFTAPTPAAAYDFLTSKPGELLVDELLNSPNRTAREFASIFSQTDPRLRGSMIIAVVTSIIWLSDKLVRRFTSSTVIPPDIGQIRNESIAMYWCLSENDVAVLKPLTSIFFTLALLQLKESTGAVPTNLFLDEFANIGRIPNFSTEIAILRGRGIAITAGLQNIEQLEDNYGRAKARVILGNFNSKIVLAGLDYESAEYISRSLGEVTLEESRTSSTFRGGLLRTIGSRTTSVSKHARRLLTADEIRRIGEREQVTITTNRKPIYSKRFWYTAAPNPARHEPLGKALTVPFRNSKSSEATSRVSEPPPIPEGL